MKELSIEQKAKRYNEVLEKARQLCAYPTTKPFIRDLQDIFPELKKSEDERIRKELIDFVKSRLAGFPQGESFIAWLEKQGEHKRFRDFIQIGDKVTRNESGELVNISQLERIAKPRRTKPTDKIKPKFKVGDSIKTANEAPLTITKITDSGYWSEDLFICSFGNADKWELVEQKPADVEEVNFFDDFRKTDSEVEPMFYVGEWITNGDYTWKIVDVKPLDYILQSQDGNIVDDTISHVDEQFHSFTIQDAKDGDVLVCKGDIKGSNGIKYERICLFKNLDSAFFTLTKTSNYIEEYDIDVNIDYPDNTVPATKEQKEILFMAMSDAGYTFDFEKKELIEESKNIKNQIMSEITDLVKDCITPKPAEWSKEDESNLDSAIYYIRREPYRANDVEPIVNWLRNLRPQKQWKPSEGQMDSITWAVRQMKESACYDSELVSLYQDLKKLREE